MLENFFYSVFFFIFSYNNMKLMASLVAEVRGVGWGEKGGGSGGRASVDT